MSERIAVVGGGISGLSAAYRLQQALPNAQVTVFEAAARFGGVISSLHHQGALCELGPDSMLRKPALMDLIEELQLQGELQETRVQARRALVLTRGSMVPVPEGFYLLAPGRWWPFLRSPLMSPLGKLRMALDVVLPARHRDAPEESLADFVRRRLGAECLERLAQPLVAGITTADPESLSVEAVFPQLVAMERRYRSLLMAMRARQLESPASGARYGLFVTFAGGVERLSQRLLEELGRSSRCQLRSQTMVTALAVPATPGISARCSLVTSQGTWEGERVVLALPAPRMAAIVRAHDAQLADLLETIPYASVATVTMAWPRSACASYPEAAGVVVPASSGSSLIAATFVDRKFAMRCPPDQILVRAFVGGALNARALACDDANLAQEATREVAQLLGITQPALWSLVSRHPGSMPQYTIGHRARVQAIRARCAPSPQLALLGNAFDGIGIGDLLEASARLAERWRR